MDLYDLILFALNCFCLLVSLAMLANPKTDGIMTLCWLVCGAINAVAVALRLADLLT